MRIPVADDHAAMRQSLVQALESDPEVEVEVVSKAPDGGAAVQLARQLQEEAPLKYGRIFPLVTPRPPRAIICQRFQPRRARVGLFAVHLYTEARQHGVNRIEIGRAHV